jgi:hypothetical protein
LYLKAAACLGSEAKGGELQKNTLQLNAGGQRRGLAPRPLDDLGRRRVVSDIRSRDRRASFTAAELRNTLATSGSKTAMFAASLMMRRQYLPRTAVE